MIRLETGSASLVGQVRTANEDALLVAEGLVAVADGMGGHLAGEVASADAVDALAQVEGSRSLDDLVRTVHWANRRISERAAEDPGMRGMGTTICVVGLVRRDDADELAILNVGDSRVYLLADGELRQLTDDHSLVEELVRDGQISRDEAQVHPQKNVLTRALGVEPLVVVDAWLLRPNDGDRLLLCSDGLTNELDDERIAELLAEDVSAEVAARRLAAEADAAGGRDNTTTVVVDVRDTGNEAEPVDDRFRKITTPAVDLSDEDHGPHTETVMAVIAAPDPTGEGPDGGDGPGEPDDGDGSAETGPAAPELPPEELQGDEDIAALAAGTGQPAPPAGATEDDEAADPADTELATARAEADAASSSAARWRTAAFVVAILGVLGLAIGAIFFTAGRGWYVTEDDDGRVALYRGTPVLWIDPALVEQAPQRVEDLTPADQARVRRGSSFGEEQDARELIESLTTTTTSTTTTTTTTTAVPTTTVPTTAVPTTAPPVPPPAPPPPGP